MVQRHEGVYDGRYKLMRYYDVDEWELYDLEADIGEQNNLAEQQGAVVEHLSKMMVEFDQELKANPRPAGAEGGRDVFEMPRIVNKR